MNPKRIKILTVSNMYPSTGHPSFGIFVKKLEDSFEANGFAISGRAVIRGQGSSSLSKVWKYFAFYIQIIIEVFLGDRHDIIYIHYVSNSSPILYPLQNRIKKPLIINFHGGDLLPYQGLGLHTQSLTKSLVEKAKLLVVPSVYFKDIVLTRYNVADYKVFVSPSAGVDMNLFKPFNLKSLEKDNLENSRIVGFVSRIVSGKGWDIFLKAISLLKTHDLSLNYKAIVVGTGDEVPEFLKMIKELGIENHVIYLGEKENSELPEIYNLFDVFVFPSKLNESLGLVALEALACGIPVIATETGGIVEYLIPNFNGFFFKSSDEKDLVRALLYFYSLSSEEKLKLKMNARSTASSYESREINKKLSEKLKAIARQQ